MVLIFTLADIQPGSSACCLFFQFTEWNISAMASLEDILMLTVDSLQVSLNNAAKADAVYFSLP